MQNNNDIECIALMRSDKAPSGYTLEYLYFDADGQIRPKSLEQSVSDKVEKIFLFYRAAKGPIMGNDYNLCRKGIENGEYAPDDAYDLLS
jgi:hypothetical protein